MALELEAHLEQRRDRRVVIDNEDHRHVPSLVQTALHGPVLPGDEREGRYDAVYPSTTLCGRMVMTPDASGGSPGRGWVAWGRWPGPAPGAVPWPCCWPLCW